jgi:predicted nucleic acid-binding protein
MSPHLLDIEVMSALRSLVRSQRVDAHLAKQLIKSLSDLPVQRYGHTQLLPRVWELRTNFTAYDASYIALAEAADATLYTCDNKLSRGHQARVKVFCL